MKLPTSLLLLVDHWVASGPRQRIQIPTTSPIRIMLRMLWRMVSLGFIREGLRDWRSFHATSAIDPGYLRPSGRSPLLRVFVLDYVQRYGTIFRNAARVWALNRRGFAVRQYCIDDDTMSWIYERWRYTPLHEETNGTYRRIGNHTVMPIIAVQAQTLRTWPGVKTTSRDRLVHRLRQDATIHDCWAENHKGWGHKHTADLEREAAWTLEALYKERSMPDRLDLYHG